MTLNQDTCDISDIPFYWELYAKHGYYESCRSRQSQYIFRHRGNPRLSFLLHKREMIYRI